MKTKTCVFYAISLLSLGLFIFVPVLANTAVLELGADSGFFHQFIASVDHYLMHRF
ncbi:MAG: hypothetical protein RL120_08465 [Gammaproteobacteria bacterium]